MQKINSNEIVIMRNRGYHSPECRGVENCDDNPVRLFIDFGQSKLDQCAVHSGPLKGRLYHSAEHHGPLKAKFKHSAEHCGPLKVRLATRTKSRFRLHLF